MKSISCQLLATLSKGWSASSRYSALVLKSRPAMPGGSFFAGDDCAFRLTSFSCAATLKGFAPAETKQEKTERRHR
jgi:hypothetical protein